VVPNIINLNAHITIIINAIVIIISIL